MLSNTELRKRYDKFGKEKATPDDGFGQFYQKVKFMSSDC